ncbi:T9SS type A sorting domain-containing protein [Adhaeribacter rhizoryzae]|nr:T9SS type A sorting domain-containing protein [Adhaeribacter rhizoryzae]
MKMISTILMYVKKGRCNLSFFIPILLVLILNFLFPASTFAQIPGFIVQKATNAGEKVLDPNTDGYVSKTTSGFISNDVGATYSEIPYRLFPQVLTEPHSDLKTGGSTNFTDLMKDPWYAYFDGNNFMFRVRVGNNSSASKGFSVLIDANNTFAGTGTNPGFEYEVLLATNFDVGIINLANNTTIYTASHLTNSQRSVALSATNSNADYFIDFFVPVSGFNGAITAATPLRLSGISVTSAQSGITGTVADIGGLNDLNYIDRNQAWSAVINSFPATSLNNILTSGFSAGATSVPAVNGPIRAGGTSISGLSTEAEGTVITVFNNDVSIGTTTVSSTGTWTLTNIASSALVAGNSITATALATSKTPSTVSNSVIVSTVLVNCTTTAPIITAFGQNEKNITGTTIYPGATIKVYRDGVYFGSTTSATTVTSGTYSWTFTPAGQGNNLFSYGTSGGGSAVGVNYATLSATVIPTSSCESPSSNLFFLPGATASTPNANTTAQPVITTSLVCATTTTLSGTAEAGALIYLYRNGIPVNGYPTTISTAAVPVAGASLTHSTTATATGSWSINLTSMGFTVGDKFTVRAKTPVSPYTATSFPSSFKGMSPVSAELIVGYCATSTAPVIVGTYCTTTSITSVSGTSTEAFGTSINIYKTGTATAIATATVNSASTWTATIPAGTLTVNSQFYASATATNKNVSASSATVTVTSQTPTTSLVIATPIKEGNGSNGTVTGTASANATVYVYIDGSLLGTTLASANGSWSLTNLSSLELYTGGLITATVKTTGLCESAQVTGGYVQCNTAPAVITASFTSAVSNICNESQVSASISNSENGIYYQLTLDNVNTGNPVVGTGGAITLISGLIKANGTLRIVARKNYSAYCETIQATTPVTVNGTVPAKPVISFSPNPICYNSTATITISSSLVAGDKYQLKKDGVLVGSEITYNSAPFTFTTDVITGTAVYAVVHKNTAGCTSTSDAVIITPQGPANNRSVTVNKNSACVNETVTISVATEYGAATPYTYAILQNGTQLTTFVGDGSVKTFTTAALANGTYTYTVRVTSSTCTVTLAQSQTVVVGQTVTTALVGATQQACYSTTLSGNQPTYGTGTWTVITMPAGAATPVFANVNQHNTLVAGLTSGTYTFRWTIAQTCNGTTSSNFKDLIVNANCATTYNVNSPYFVNGYDNLDVLAFAYDTEGFKPAVTNFTLTSGALPAGVSLNAITGEIFVSNSSTLSKIGIYTYRVTITATDALNNTTINIPVTLFFYPAASQTSMDNNPYTVLPVELLYFRAKQINGEVNLVWATATETENQGFEIERSQDGKIFKKIGQVAGAGTSLELQKYTFRDRTVLSGTVYYRLKQVDFIGTYTYSAVAALKADGNNQPKLLAYPNPTKGKITLVLQTPTSEKYNLEIRDLAGKLVLTEKAIFSNQTDELVLNLQHLPAGTYLVSARSEASVLVTRIIKN